MAEYIDREIYCNNICRCPGTECDKSKCPIWTAPAADVAPVVHSRWIETKDQNKKRCGRCDVIHLIAQYPNGNANFCPNCGAKMDGGGHGN